MGNKGTKKQKSMFTKLALEKSRQTVVASGEYINGWLNAEKMLVQTLGAAAYG